MTKETTAMFKFCTRNFLGKPVQHYLVEERVLPTDAPTKQRIGHHILVVDCSGSMCGDIGDVREKIRKMLTLDEYRDSSMLVSLLSYSSSGDLVSHFERVPVADIVKSKNTKAQREIGGLKARGMTCMTQALEAALRLIKATSQKGELTAVSLHTDGYFNDPSPTAEFRKIDELITDFKKSAPDAFVNTIGYRDYCDFQILDKIANALSGKCWRARDIKTFYDSIYDTSALLAGQSAPAIYLEKKPDFDYQTFISSCGKIIGGDGDLSINGVKPDATKTVYAFKKVSAETYKTTKALDAGEHPALVFAKCKLAEGRVNEAKYAVVSTRRRDILDIHARAISSEDIAAFSATLESECMNTGSPSYTVHYGIDTSVASVPKVLKLLSKHLDDFLIDFEALNRDYKRRGLRRLAGKWVDGKLIKPSVKTELRDEDRWVRVSAFEFNRNTAVVNMRVARPCRLVLVKTGDEVKKLGGIKLDLRDFKQYTLVGDGAICAPRLEIRVTSKVLHNKLVAAKVIAGEFDHTRTHVVDLASRPLVDYATKFEAATTLPDKLAVAHAVDKLLGALVKEKSAELSEAQVTELKDHYVTSSLYVSLPTTTPYQDLQKALADGEVDARLSRQVTIGNPLLVDPSDLYSANEFLNRWYEVTSDKLTEGEKPTMLNWYDSGFKVAKKKLGPRVKVTEVDKVMEKVFDDFFGLEATTPNAFNSILGVALMRRFAKVIERKVKGDAMDEILADTRARAAEHLDELYEEDVSPLVFFIGNSGLIPDEFGDVPALTADKLAERYPEVKLTKSQRENGTFYDLGGGLIVTVLTTSAYYTTEKGLHAIEEIEKQAVTG